MKYKTILILLFSISINSQEVQQVEVVKNDNQISELFEELGQNELKLDLIDILSLPAFDITYERIKDPYSSFGVSMFINAGDNDSASRNWTDKFSLTPFYRFYFFNKRDYGGAGFFAEIFTKFSSGKHDVSITISAITLVQIILEPKKRIFLILHLVQPLDKNG